MSDLVNKLHLALLAVLGAPSEALIRVDLALGLGLELVGAHRCFAGHGVGALSLGDGFAVTSPVGLGLERGHRVVGRVGRGGALLVVVVALVGDLLRDALLDPRDLGSLGGLGLGRRAVGRALLLVLLAPRG